MENVKHAGSLGLKGTLSGTWYISHYVTAVGAVVWDGVVAKPWLGSAQGKLLPPWASPGSSHQPDILLYPIIIITGS